jgi:hypothetical protein
MMSSFVGTTALIPDALEDKTPALQGEIPVTTVDIPPAAATSSVVTNHLFKNVEEEDSRIDQIERAEGLSVGTKEEEEQPFHISSIGDHADLPAEANDTVETNDRERSFRPMEEGQAQRTRTAINGWIQLGALTEKNIRIKTRSPFSTLLEIFSPLIFSSILVLSYRLSRSKY